MIYNPLFIFFSSYLLLFIIWFFLPAEAYQLFGITKSYSITMIVHIIFVFIVSTLAFTILKPKERIRFTANRLPIIKLKYIRIFSLVALVAGCLLIFNGLLFHHVELVTLNFERNIGNMRLSHLAPVTTLNEISKVTFAFYMYLIYRQDFKAEVVDKFILISIVILNVYLGLYMARTNIFVIGSIFLFFKFNNIKIFSTKSIIITIFICIALVYTQSLKTSFSETRSEYFLWPIYFVLMYFASSFNYLINLDKVRDLEYHPLTGFLRGFSQFFNVDLGFSPIYRSEYSGGGMSTITVIGEYFVDLKQFSIIYFFIIFLFLGYIYFRRNRHPFFAIMHSLLLVPVAYLSFINIISSTQVYIFLIFTYILSKISIKYEDVK